MSPQNLETETVRTVESTEPNWLQKKFADQQHTELKFPRLSFLTQGYAGVTRGGSVEEGLLDIKGSYIRSKVSICTDSKVKYLQSTGHDPLKYSSCLLDSDESRCSDVCIN